jgi:hypothetical protein
MAFDTASDLMAHLRRLNHDDAVKHLTNAGYSKNVIREFCRDLNLSLSVHGRDHLMFALLAVELM